MASQRRIGAVMGYGNIVVKNLVNLLYTPLLLHFVGQGDYGVFQMSNSFVFSLTLLSFGFSEAYVRFYSQRKAHGGEEDIRRLNGMYLVLYSVIVVVCLLLGSLFVANVQNLFSRGLTPDEMVLAKSLMSVMVVNVAVTLFSTVFDAFLLVHERFFFQQSRQMLATVLTPVLAVVLLNLGMGAVGVACAQLATNVVLLALNIRFAVGKLGMRFSLRHLDFALLRGLAAFSFWILLNQVCELVNQQVPNFLLGALASSAMVAVYSISVQIRSVFYSLSGVMSNVFVPKINRMVAATDDNHELTLLMTRVGRYQMMLFCFVYGGFAVVGRYFVHIWAGPQNDAAYYLALAMTLPLAVPLTQNTGIEIQRAKNRHQARSVAYVCTAALNVALTLALIPRLGYWAPAVGYITSVVLGTGLFMNWYYQRRIGLDMVHFWKSNLPVVLYTAAVVLVCMVGTRFIAVDGIATFLMWGVCYSLLFLAATWPLGLRREERAAIIRRIRHTAPNSL